MSPSRSRNTGQDGFAPGPSKLTSSKNLARSRSPSPTQAQSRGAGANLGSPAKASGKSQGVVFLGAGRSPSKQKGKARDRSKSPSKGAQHEAVQPPPPPPADASYVTSATPAPSSSHLLRKASSFITPASNVGEAGARRMRYGEMMDALAGNNLEDGSADPDLDSDSRTRPMTEEELYPEIEYMAPSHCAKDPPYDFDPRLDGLPRGKQLGEALSKCSAIGFHRPTPSEEDLLRREGLKEADLPALEGLSIRDDEDNDVGQEAWPDVVIKAKQEGLGSQAPVKKPVSPIHRRPAPPSMNAPIAKLAAGKTLAAKSRPSVASSNRAPVKPVATARARPTLGTAPPKTAGSTAVKGNGATAAAAPRLALKPKNGNQQLQMHPLLRNVQDDDLGKQIDARLKQSMQSREGFAIDD
ncbi:hypothetical protein FA10DRAFT_267127 [Acaromyces ingoldii]|uniref:Uncharacterized protein n=1 Tax=Acaromyces ingoldii TaxID=215250 RepID=A0A316YN40_9BASI|nr:hypothetical protein FA10DRAFT_267127 [Acaromyces ingoldii]PWN90679.1 hypothetical protein FA10DRAFT_267127 [Acaromyces ingoldii]